MKTTLDSPDLTSHELYQDPKLICDVVMKGGITSGVTYPKAICEIARAYKLRNIGGTSAGAIAAAAAAAAEVGRGNRLGGFGRLATLPDRLAAPSPGRRTSVLLNLFQPSRATRPLHRILTGSLRGQPIRSILAAAPIAALLGGAFGIGTSVLIWLLSRRHPNLGGDAFAVVAMALGLLAGLLSTLVGVLAGVGFRVFQRAAQGIPGNGFGICSGFVPSSNGPPPLTTWLADELDKLAGVTDPRRPVTLGHVADSGCNVRMFTTNLTDGTPYTLPFRSRTYFFSKKEFDDLFPERIVTWMVDHPPEGLDSSEKDTAGLMAEHKPSLLPLPDPQNLPLVVMARLSLSFPILLSAIPLWTRIWSPESEEVETVRCWFSDGGITSNFPIHFFDSPLPRWPTFGINLGPGTNLDPTNQEANIWAPMENGQGAQARWGRIESLGDFAHAIADTIQNWMDNAQVRLPGYRDRVVLIKHTKDEGGMNLDMGTDLIHRFSERGRCAGEFLVKRFSTQPSGHAGDQLSWENHRWVRYRSVMPLIEDLVIRVVGGYDWPPEPNPSRTYEQLIAAAAGPGLSYKMTAQQRARAETLTGLLVGLGRDWGMLPDPLPGDLPAIDLSPIPESEPWDPAKPFKQKAPRPRPALRIVRDF